MIVEWPEITERSDNNFGVCHNFVFLIKIMTKEENFIPNKFSDVPLQYSIHFITNPSFNLKASSKTRTSDVLVFCFWFCLGMGECAVWIYILTQNVI